MKQRYFLNLKGEKEIVEDKDILAKLKLGYKIPIQIVILFNQKTKDTKHIKTQYKSSQKRIIELLESGYALTTYTKASASKKGIDSTHHAKNTKSLSPKIKSLEEDIKQGQELAGVFKHLSQINIERSKALQEENESLRNQIEALKKPFVSNLIAQHLMEIIASNLLEEIVLSHKGDVYTFSGSVKVKK
jgi:hypothetical protein